MNGNVGVPKPNNWTLGKLQDHTPFHSTRSSHFNVGRSSDRPWQRKDLRQLSRIGNNLVAEASTPHKLLRSPTPTVYTKLHSPASAIAFGSEPRSLSNTELVDRVRAILQAKRLTLYQCSRKTMSMYGRSSPYFLPHNLYYDLSNETFSPSLHQLFALSKVSGYRFNDWLRVFGFNPEDIARLQILLSSKRTLLLDSSLADPEVFDSLVAKQTRVRSRSRNFSAWTTAGTGAITAPSRDCPNLTMQFGVCENWPGGRTRLSRPGSWKHRAG